MALPLTVTLFPLTLPIAGTFRASSGALYAVGVSADDATKIRVIKATDATTSWAAVGTDPAVTNAVTVDWVSAWQDGNTLHIATSSTPSTATNADYYYHTFSMATDAWTSSPGGGEAIETAVPVNAAAVTYRWISICKRSQSGEIFVTYPKLFLYMTTNYTNPWYNRRTTSWVGSASLLQTNGNFAAATCVPDPSNDRVIFSVILDNNALYIQALSAANAIAGNTVSAIQQVAPTAGVVSITLWNNAGTYRGVTGAMSTTAGSFAATRFTVADTPGLTRVLVASVAGYPVRVFNDGTNVGTADVWMLYRNTSDSDLYVKKSADSGATWGSAIDVQTASVAANAIVSIDGDRLGTVTSGDNVVISYFVNDNGTLKYNEYIIRQSPYKRAAFAGAGALVGNVTVVSSGPTIWQASAVLNGAGALTAPQTTEIGAVTGTFGGTGSVAANTVEIGAITGAFGGAGAITAKPSGITFTAGAFGGTGGLSVVTYYQALANGSYGGTGALTGYLAGFDIAKGAWSGAGALTVASIQIGAANGAFTGAGALVAQSIEYGAITGSFLGAGNFTSYTVGLDLVAASFAGTGSLSAVTIALDNITAAFSGAGSLTAMWQAAATIWQASAAFGGTGALAAPQTIGLDVVDSALGGAGGLTVYTFYQALANGSYSGSGALTGYLAGFDVATGSLSGAGAWATQTIELGAITGAFVGSGGFLVATIQIGEVNATFSGSGLLIAQTIGIDFIAAAFNGAGLLSADATAISAASIFATFGGSGSLVAPQTIQLGAVDAAALGSGTLTAPQTVQLGAVDATAAGAGGLSVYTFYQALANGTYNGAGAVTGYLFGIDEIASRQTGAGALTVQTVELGASSSFFAGAGLLFADATEISALGVYATFGGSGALTAPKTIGLDAINGNQSGSGLLSVYTFYQALANGAYSGSGAATGFLFGIDLVNARWNGTGGFTAFWQPPLLISAEAAFFGQGLWFANATAINFLARPTVKVVTIDYRVGPQPLTYGANPVLNEAAALIINLGFLPQAIPVLSFIRPDGAVQQATPQYLYIGQTEVVQFSNTFYPGQYLVYAFANNELDAIGPWTVQVVAGGYVYPPSIFVVERSPQMITLLGA